MMSSQETRCPEQTPEVALTSMSQDHHVLERADGSVGHVLNESARAIWDLCDGRTLPSEMVTGIMQLFGVERAVVALDVDRVLHDLQAAGLIAWTPVLTGGRER